MSDADKTVTILTHEEFVQESMALVASGEFAEAAELAFELYNAIIEDFRNSKDSDKPSIKQAAEKFEASDEVANLAENLMDEVRALVHSHIAENPELSVLLYEELKDYAQDHVKVFRDAVLRGYMNENEEDSEESDYELPMTKDELKQVRDAVGSYTMLAEMNKDRKPEIPVKKSGSFAFANPRGYGEDGSSVKDTKDEVKFVYFLDGEELPQRTTMDVALYALTTPSKVYRSSDVYAIVRKQHGNKNLSEGWKIDVDGRILEARPVGN